MPFIQIPHIYTADPANVWAAKSSFVSTDPFAIVMRVQISSDILQAGMSSDTVFQMVNPREDPYGGSWYTYTSATGVMDMDTKDTYWNNVPFRFTDFARSMSWGRYVDAVSQILGPERDRGVFLVRGTINVLGSNLFAPSGEFWYKVVP